MKISASTTTPNPISRRAALRVGAGLVAGSIATSCTDATAAANAQSEWWSWRGPTGNNHAAPGTSIPASIRQSNVLWSTDIPGRGHSSPIVVGDAIYLTTADKAAGWQAAIALGRDGNARWKRTIHQGGIPAENHKKNTEASSTMAFDGEHLFAAFYNSDAIRLTSLTVEGEIRWSVKVGDYRPNQFKYGYAASPRIYGETVIVVGDYDGRPFLAERRAENDSRLPRRGEASSI